MGRPPSGTSTLVVTVSMCRVDKPARHLRNAKLPISSANLVFSIAYKPPKNGAQFAQVEA
jgi:hypothetical protein